MGGKERGREGVLTVICVTCSDAVEQMRGRVECKQGIWLCDLIRNAKWLQTVLPDQVMLNVLPDQEGRARNAKWLQTALPDQVMLNVLPDQVIAI